MEPSDLLKIVVDILDGLRLRYFVTGSMATILYGEPRYTNDIDILVELPFIRVSEFCNKFPTNEFYISPDAVRDAVANADQFNVIHPASGLKLDFIILKRSPFDLSRLSRRRRLQAGEDFQAEFASPEDVILKKLEFFKVGGSEKHLRDIAGVLKLSGAQIDHAYIDEWANKLDVKDVWQQCFKK